MDRILTLSDSCYSALLKIIDGLPLWDVLDPKNGLFVALLDEKYKNGNYLKEVLFTFNKKSKTMKNLGQDLLNIKPSKRCGFPTESNLDRLQFPDVLAPYNRFECSKYFHEEIMIPLLKKLLDKGYHKCIKLLCKLYLFLDKDYWLGKFFTPISVYVSFERKVNDYRCLLCLRNYSKIPLLVQSLANILTVDREDRFETFNFLLHNFEEILNQNPQYRIRLLVIMVESGLTFEVFNKALELCDGNLKEEFREDILLKSSYKAGNVSMFMHLINRFPDLVEIFNEPVHWCVLIEKPIEIIEYICEKLPGILPLIDTFLSGNEQSNGLRYKSPISLDLRNLYKVPCLFKYFSKRKTIDCVYDQWLKNLEVTYEDCLSRTYYISTFLAIIRCRDAYGLSIQEAGMKLCKLCMQLSTLVVLFGFTPSLSDIIAQVLTIFMEYGFTYTKNFPWELDGTLKSSRWIASLLWYISDSSVKFPEEFYQYLELKTAVKSLEHLTIVVARKSIKAPFKQNVNSLRLPKRQKLNILMESELKESIFFKRIDRRKYERIDVNVAMSKTPFQSEERKKTFIEALEHYQVILNWIPQINAFGKEIAMLPLLFVLSVTALKDGYEDYKRYKNDKKVNNRRCQIYDQLLAKFCDDKWKNIKVGDIIRVEENESIPADILLVKSSDAQGVSYVDTASLDGEFNLKQRFVCKEVSNCEWSKFKAKIACDRPNKDLHSFRGTIEYFTELKNPDIKVRISKDNLLLRGSTVRNVNYVDGIVVYTGHETKMMLNAQGPRYKRSALEIRINYDVLWCCVLLFLMCFGCSLGNGLWLESYRNTSDVPFIAFDDDKTPKQRSLLLFWTYIILFQASVMIPLSLYVTIDFIKIIQVIFIQMDKELKDSEGRGCICRALNITEDLGQVEHIFTDKTGTLTENSMVFKRFSIAGIDYIHKQDNKKTANSVKCNSDSNDQIELEAITLHDKPSQSISEMINVTSQQNALNHQMGHFFLLLTICNTVFVSRKKNENNEIISKFEAESTDELCLVEAAFEKNCKLVDRQLNNVYITFGATYGLRTLCMAYRIIDDSEYENWLQGHLLAENSQSEQDKLLYESACRIESNLVLLGATGIEDRLQEGVPDAIESLRNAGLKIWMLTGDKQETAINVGQSCGLIKKNDYVTILKAESLVETISLLRQDLSMTRVLVLESQCLEFILHPDAIKHFLKISNNCSSVLCCRVTPSQKSKVVEKLQKAQKRLCLAIGDGANDVSMIREASIGIGIYGSKQSEGNSAAMASDFTLPNFQGLKRLLLVHGHWCYQRLVTVALYMWYKNAVFIFLLLWFQFFNGFSAITFLDDLNLMFYQLLYTSLPPIILGIFDQDISADKLMKKPELYKQGSERKAFRGSDIGQWEFGATCLASSVIISLLHICIEAKSLNLPLIGSVLLSFAVYILTNISLNSICVVCSPPANPVGVTVYSFRNSVHWFCVLLSTVLALLPRIIGKSIKNIKYPSLVTAERLNKGFICQQLWYDNPVIIDETHL
ncbi:DgyrCDS2561 [Dimorphilus gyrociliatus]|uniref:P-type phospholipid transporter n=1 Tax=Dimorphilus gyrociliatus TaxID=2664684 RepID=A0A7I8VDG8_9ANNE|nr:DgyrCDS2561 [Dimorphilus gyrociliatus]